MTWLIPVVVAFALLFISTQSEDPITETNWNTSPIKCPAGRLQDCIRTSEFQLISPVCVGGFCVPQSALARNGCSFHSECSIGDYCASHYNLHVCVPRDGYQKPICMAHHHCLIHDTEPRIMCLGRIDREVSLSFGVCVPRLCQIPTDCDPGEGWRTSCQQGVCVYSNETLPESRLLVHVDDSLSGIGLEKAKVIYQCVNGNADRSNVTEVTQEDGLIHLTVSPECLEMKLTVISDGYANGLAIIPIEFEDEGSQIGPDGAKKEGRETQINLSLAPKQFGKDVIIRAVLNWSSHRKDLDLHVMAFDDLGQVSCHVSHSKKQCSHMSLDRDNTKTGDHGSETISFTKGSFNKFVIYVKVYPEYRYLFKSGARLTLYSVGSITLAVNLPSLSEAG
eukprot:maker-scaffold28_size608977-snap-gene-3.12 protein:Tk05751 transcript:maker-scaffold28_size608977-snap-gene-3.12-mRNA-1 annotation:"hypothetical protein GUITHDRAFT_145380"